MLHKSIHFHQRSEVSVVGASVVGESSPLVVKYIGRPIMRATITRIKTANKVQPRQVKTVHLGGQSLFCIIIEYVKLCFAAEMLPVQNV